MEAIRQTSEALGNTPAVARKSYVHPAVLQAYLDGGIGDALVEAAEDQAAPPAESTEDEEAGVVDLLRQRLELDATRSKGRAAPPRRPIATERGTRHERDHGRHRRRPSGSCSASPAVGIAIRLIVLYLVILWIASAWWVWRDARTRSSDPFVPYIAAGCVILVTPLLFPLAIVVYRLMRPRLTVSAATSVELQLAMLEEEASALGVLDVRGDGRRGLGRLSVLRRRARGPVRVVRPAAGARLADLRLVRRGGAVGPATASRPARRVPREAVAIPIRPGGRPLLPVMAAPEDEPEVVGSPAARRRGTSSRRSTP